MKFDTRPAAPTDRQPVPAALEKFFLSIAWTGAILAAAGCAATTTTSPPPAAAPPAEEQPAEAAAEAVVAAEGPILQEMGEEAEEQADSDGAVEVVATLSSLPPEVSRGASAPAPMKVAPPPPPDPPASRAATGHVETSESAEKSGRRVITHPKTLMSRGGAAKGRDPESALGVLMGDSAGEAYGYGGLGVRGTGRGGGGSGSGTIGLGSIGTIGRGAGGASGSGYGRGAPSKAPRGRASSARRSDSGGESGAPLKAATLRGRRSSSDPHYGGAAGPVVLTGAEQLAIARRLTAAVVSDHDERRDYLSFLERHAGERAAFGLDMTRRLRLRVVDEAGRPLHDVAITMLGSGFQTVGRTHADGIWDFYPGVSAPGAAGSTTAYLQTPAGATAMATIVVPPGGDGRDVVIRMPGSVASSPRALDLGFLIDATGSMGDELEYVTAEVAGIVSRVRAASPGVRLRVGATLYRDRGDVSPLQQIPFTENVDAFRAALSYVHAEGGGDYPEDLNAGLAAAVHTLRWSHDAAARVLVLIADAPPQRYADAQYDYSRAMRDAGERGIRILPVAASGADRSVEFLFRSMGAFTSSPYVYLTDDSGIGGTHLEADSDAVTVEMFSDSLTRLLISDLRGEGMHAPRRASPGFLVPAPGQ